MRFSVYRPKFERVLTLTYVNLYILQLQMCLEWKLQYCVIKTFQNNYLLIKLWL